MQNNFDPASKEASVLCIILKINPDGTIKTLYIVHLLKQQRVEEWHNLFQLVKKSPTPFPKESYI